MKLGEIVFLVFKKYFKFIKESKHYKEIISLKQSNAEFVDFKSYNYTFVGLIFVT